MIDLVEDATQMCLFEFKTPMYGNEDLLYEDNCCVSDAVHRYLEATKGFSLCHILYWSLLHLRCHGT